MRGHPGVDQQAVIAAMRTEAGELARRFLAVFEPGDVWPTDEAVEQLANWYANSLYGSNGVDEDEARTFAVKAASEVVSVLAGEKSRDSSWWATPLARAAAWWIGYPEESVPQSVAANILNVRRQAIPQFIKSGTLKTVAREGAAPGVDRESLLALLHRRYRDF